MSASGRSARSLRLTRRFLTSRVGVLASRGSCRATSSWMRIISVREVLISTSRGRAIWTIWALRSSITTQTRSLPSILSYLIRSSELSPTRTALFRARQFRQSQLQLPYPQFTSFSGDSPPWASSIYNALQVRVEKRFSHGLQALVTYTWSKSIDDASSTDGSVTWLGGISNGPQDPNNRRLERSLSTFDIPHVLQFSYVYELPIGRGKAIGGNMPPVLNAIIGGWQTNGIWRFTDGRPLLLMLSGSQSLPTYGDQRPNLLGPLHCNSGSDFITNYFSNPDVAVAPPPFTLGNAPRSYGGCRAPGQNNATLSVFKDFLLPKLREGARLQFRIEAFNALNHPQFDAPDTHVNGGNFGVITGTANGPREVQLALKFYW